jgi:signal transduction histidine kinase/CheY-like chemotaxis protein
VAETIESWIVENMRDAVVVTDATGRVVTLNRAARELGIDVDWLLRQEVLVQARDKASTEVSAADALGTLRQLAIESRKHEEHTVFVIRDVSVKGELAELRRIESLGLVSASALHDFNNLLGAIIGSAAVLERQLGEGPGASIATELRRTSDRAAGIARQILAFSRRERGHARPIDPGATVLELEPLLARIMGDGIALRLEVDADAGMIVADREHLEHALLNLAASARESMPRGGHLTISVAPVTLGEEGAIDVPAAGSYVVITLADTGVGMTPDARERIFERLATKAHGKATGIASAQRFASESNGCITVRSELAHGTSVILYVPRIDGVPSSPTSGTEPLAGGSESILVVEDEPHLRYALCLLLEDLGYDTVSAESGATAVEICSTRMVDLVLSDVIMPGVHGRDLAERLRAHAPRTPLLFMSGYEEGVLSAQGLDEWGPVLRKPFSPKELARRVRDALERSSRH